MGKGGRGKRLDEKKSWTEFSVEISVLKKPWRHLLIGEEGYRVTTLRTS